jgi:ribose transport system permease protein
VTATPATGDEGRIGRGGGVGGGAGRVAGAAVEGLRALRRDTWTLSLFGLLIALLAVAKILSPGYGATDLTSLAIAALPVAFAAIAMAIAVIAGGIDLSVGAIMALTSVAAASQMAGASPEFSVLVVIGTLVFGLAVGAVNGLLIVTSRVPDIVVTLAMSYVWAGAALLVLNSPGGGAADWLKNLITGSVLVDFVPKALVVLVISVGIVWLPLRRSRLGLSIYAIGSNQLAAFRGGVDVRRTKVMAYALTGLFAAAGGLTLTASTGIGTPIPGPYTLLAVAAIVLGGVSLAGGRGGMLGPIVAVFILQLVRTDLTFLGVDPNFSTVVQGLIMVAVVMIGAFVTLRRKRIMTSTSDTPVASRPSAGATIRRTFRDRPIVPLLVLLAALVVSLQLVQPGMLTGAWLSTTMRFAVPLAILAACQTMTMLTGGIDLSVATVASLSAYIVYTQTPGQGPWIAIVIALIAALVVGVANGIGVGIFRVHPLIMTIGMSLVVLGLITVYQLIMVAGGSRISPEVAWLGGGTSFGFLPNSLFLFVPLAAVLLFILHRTGFGRLLYAVGDNETAARLSGVRVWQVLLVLYVLAALLAGIAGVVYGGLTNTATATLADGLLLPSVAAAVIGGTSIFGGRGGYEGSIVGAVILTVLTTLLTVLQAPEPVRQILFGVIILAVASAYTRITDET